MVCNYTTSYQDDCYRLIMDPPNCVCFGMDRCQFEELMEEEDCPSWHCYQLPIFPRTPPPKTKLDTKEEIGLALGGLILVVAALVLGYHLVTKAWSKYQLLRATEEGAVEAHGKKIRSYLSNSLVIYV